MKIEETSENIIHFKIRTFVALVGGLVIGTNVVNTVITDIIENRERIQYNEDADTRRRAHLEEKMNYQIQIKDLKRDLKDCKDGK
jgi:hypothetical protein